MQVDGGTNMPNHVSLIKMKFWKKKDKSKSTNPFDDDSDSNSFSTEYSQTPTAVSEPTHKGRYSTAPPPKPISSRNYSQDRQNLFSGHNDPTNHYDSSGQEDAYRTSKFNEKEEDQEISQIQRQIHNVKQDSLASTRNALQKIGEAESAAANTMNMLGTQSSMYTFLYVYSLLLLKEKNSLLFRSNC